MFDLAQAGAWQTRERPLAASAAYAKGVVWVALLQKLMHLDDEQLSAYEAVGSADEGIVIGADIPWVDGVRYCGKEAGFYMPTDLGPLAPTAFVAAALKRECGKRVLVLPGIAAYDLSEATPLSQFGLTKFIKQFGLKNRIERG